MEKPKIIQTITRSKHGLHEGWIVRLYCNKQVYARWFFDRDYHRDSVKSRVAAKSNIARAIKCYNQNGKLPRTWQKELY